MKKIILLLVLFSAGLNGQTMRKSFESVAIDSVIRYDSLATTPSMSSSDSKSRTFWKAGADGLIHFYRLHRGTVKMIDSAGGAFKIRAAGSVYRNDSITIKGTAGTLVTQSNDTITINADSVRKSSVSDSITNTLQYVWKRTAGGMADLVNPADTVFVGKNTGYNAFLPTGKLNFNQANGSGTYSMVFGGDSSSSLDAGYMIGRMNNNKRWLVGHLGASNILRTAIVNNAGGIDFYYSITPSGMGVAVVNTNTFDVAGNTSISAGTPPVMSGTGNLYVHGTLSAGFANTSAVNAGENILLGIDSDADGIYIGGEYPKDGDNARNMYRQEGVTTTADVTPTAKAIFGMNLAGDSTCTIMVEANVVAYRSGGGTPANRGQASYKLIGTFGYENSAVIQLGTTTVVHSAESDAALACTLSASGNNIILTFTGLTGESWRWYAYSNRYYAGHISQ